MRAAKYLLVSAAFLSAGGFFLFSGNDCRYKREISGLAFSPKALVVFGGDMMFDRSVRAAMKENG